MRFSENRPIAYAVLAVVIIASLIFGGGGALKERRTALVNQYNASSFSISAELMEMRSNAVKIQNIGMKYNAADNKLISSLGDTVSALDAASNAGDVNGQYAASLLLSTAVETCYAHLSGLALSDADASDVRYAYRNFTSAQLRITHDSYNTLAAQFNADLARFPANMLGTLCGVDPLGLFQAANTAP